MFAWWSLRAFSLARKDALYSVLNQVGGIGEIAHGYGVVAGAVNKIIWS
jgi:hypothetical protein